MNVHELTSVAMRRFLSSGQRSAPAEFSLQSELQQGLQSCGFPDESLTGLLTDEAQVEVMEHLENARLILFVYGRTTCCGCATTLEGWRREAVPHVQVWKLLAYAGARAQSLPLTADDIMTAAQQLS
jgi:hypothetical protein